MGAFCERLVGVMLIFLRLHSIDLSPVGGVDAAGMYVGSMLMFWRGRSAATIIVLLMDYCPRVVWRIDVAYLVDFVL